MIWVSLSLSCVSRLVYDWLTWCLWSQISNPTGPISFAKKIFHTMSALLTSPGKPKDATGHKRFRTNPSLPLYMERSPEDHWGQNKGRSWGSAEKRTILYLLSLCPVTFWSVPGTAQKREGNLKKKKKKVKPSLGICKQCQVASSYN